ncbi:unnamed protein product [Callosobruchus maculatus]|uniref:Uncharacterized protein n=1 Tax=Callosobruchus maculatus TaxID=64391 RepID=A0A653C0Y2_CALMS|nr:unnamed protein product [Callosobruchus maculatus]
MRVNANYDGSTHDSFIWRNNTYLIPIWSQIIWEQIEILGDSGDPQQPWLMTSFSNTIAIYATKEYGSLLKIRFCCLAKESVEE